VYRLAPVAEGKCWMSSTENISADGRFEEDGIDKREDWVLHQKRKEARLR
jgi:hypothetical protein